MDHDEGATWCHRVAGEIEWASVDPVICRDGRLVRVRSYHVERKFCLWYEFVPKVDGERRVRASEDCDKVPLEGLYGAARSALFDRLCTREHTRKRCGMLESLVAILWEPRCRGLGIELSSI